MWNLLEIGEIISSCEIISSKIEIISLKTEIISQKMKLFQSIEIISPISIGISR